MKFKILSVAIFSTISLSTFANLTTVNKNINSPVANKNIVVKEVIKSTTNNKVFAVQEIATHVAMAPTIIQKASKNIGSKANQILFFLNSDLELENASGESIQTLKSYLDQEHKVIPVLEVKNIETLEALKALSKSYDLSDLTLLSNNPEILRESHRLLPLTRTVLDLHAVTNLQNTPKDLDQIAQSANHAFARIVIIPNQFLSKSNVRFLQRLLITVWANPSIDSEYEAGVVLATGVNGIITSQSELFAKILKQFPQNTLLRRPFVIGHRGVPSLEDENTVQSAKHALNLGADIVENDIYITKDNHLIVMHDETVDRTTNGKGKIEEMTLAQVKQLSTKTKSRQVPTLEEYFASMKPINHRVLMVELKSANPKIVPELKNEVEKYHFEDHLVTTSFHRDQILRMKTYLPGISTGALVGKLPNSNNLLSNVSQVMLEAQKYNSTYNPAYQANLIPIMEATKHRGITFWPWALDDQTFKKLYVAGTHGITTNSAQLYSKYIVDIKTATSVTVKAGQKFYINAELKAQDGTILKGKANQYIVLAGSPNYKMTAKKDAITFTQKGTAFVLAGYQYHIDNQYFYNIFTAPVRVSVQ